jgi:ferric-dicitrate binding protein FerR (iron transport regulator)
METDGEKFQSLLKKYEAKQCTQEEIAWLESWYLQWNELNKENLSRAELDEAKPIMWNSIEEQTQLKRTVRLWPRIAAAAAILLVAGAGLFFYTSYYAARHPGGSEATRDLLNYANDIAPGKNTATITLANGSTIVLSDAKTGVVVGAESLTYNDGGLVQGASGTHFSGSLKSDQKNTGPVSAPSPGVEGVHSPSAKEMLTASTPRGGTYQITLPDGTKVWLNAASSLKFPSTFKELKNRKVELTGEAYFEVAKDAAHPFKVNSNGQEVTVLGTHFNINSYNDEPSTKTTLLEGSVKVSYQTSPPVGDPSLAGGESHDANSRMNKRDAGKSIILKPGQQSVLHSGNANITVKQVDTELAVAWKLGFFSFDNASLENVMQQIGRWYNVEVVYAQPELKSKKFSGTISRYDHISGLLGAIQKTGVVGFKIEERKITVL